MAKVWFKKWTTADSKHKYREEASRAEVEKISANSQETLIIKRMTWFYKSCENTNLQRRRRLLTVLWDRMEFYAVWSNKEESFYFWESHK